MTISYSLPLTHGWNRMKKALFQPFNLEKWIYIGFTAFLAGLTQFGAGGGTGNAGNKLQNFDWDKFLSIPSNVSDFLLLHPVWFALIIIGFVLLVTFVVVLNWVSSRGKFMFLDNVIHDRDEIRKPWNEYRAEGNSYFWWTFFYGWVVFGVIILLIVYGFGIAKNIHLGVITDTSKVSFIIGFVFTIIALLVIFGYISLFLNDFIIPIMYKHRISAMRAWSKFLTLALHHPGELFVYGLFIFALNILVGIAIIFAAVFTCCIGIFILIIPFVGTVVLLPVSYTFRALSIEFLAQFGDEYKVLE